MRRTFVVLLVALIAFTGLALASDEEQHTAAFVIAGSRATPEYPPAALAAGFEGAVTVAAVINEDGSIGVVEVVESTSPRLGFEEAALDAFRQWRFAPATQDNEPVFSVWAYSFYFSSPGGRMNPSPYVSGDFVVSILAGSGASVSLAELSCVLADRVEDELEAALGSREPSLAEIVERYRSWSAHKPGVKNWA